MLIHHIMFYATLTLSEDYMYSNGWRGHSIRLTLVVKDEKDPNLLIQLRGPEDSLVYASQRFYPSASSYPAQTPSLISSPTSSAYVLPPSPTAFPDVSKSPLRSNHVYGPCNPYTSLALPTTSAYQPAVSNVSQPVMPVQQSCHVYNTYLSSTLSGPQRLSAQAIPQSHPPPQYRQSVPTLRPMGKTLAPQMRSGLPHNQKENDGRTVYVYNLPYTASQQAIKEHLASAGLIDRCLVKEDRGRSSKYKLTAVVTFRNPQQAQTAIDRFNRTLWKDYEIKVKLDRGPNAMTPPPARNAPAAANGKSSSAARPRQLRRETRDGPLVVNGSGPSISTRQTRIDSDDESSCDEGK
jgi:RNA recognition motif. (a.k.a. RRM, RBD, or RNP domain)